MEPAQQKRRVARIPVACAVVVRERSGAWSTETQDVGARGCRISLTRPLARGTLVTLQFQRGAGQEPLDVVGQVAWTRPGAPASAGVAFVNVPRDRQGAQSRNWIDDLVAAHLRRAVASWPAEASTLARLGAVSVELGIPPTQPLDPHEVSLVRLVREGASLGTLTRSREAAAVFVRLLELGAVSVCRATPDPEGWKKTFARMASGGAAATGGRTPSHPAR